MEDNDIFMMTQQQAKEDDNDNLYESIAKAIAVKKCRLVQKKEKAKLQIQALKKLNEELKLAKEERLHLIKEQEELDHQQASASNSLKNTQESRASLETMLCDLTNKVLLEKAETKKRSEDYQLALQESNETWESYEKVYNEFPLAKEIQASKLEMKKLDIKTREILVLIADTKRQKKLKDEITGKRLVCSSVDLAKSYFVIQEKISQRDALLKQKRELEKTIEEIKTESITKPCQAKTQVQSKVTRLEDKPKAKTFQKSWDYNFSDMQINSPPSPASTVQPFSRSLFDWSALLSSSSSLFSFTKQSQNKQLEERSKTTELKQTNSISTAANRFQDFTKKLTEKQEIESASNSWNTTVKNVPLNNSKKQIESAPIEAPQKSTTELLVSKRKIPMKSEKTVSSENQIKSPLKKVKDQSFPSSKPISEILTQQKPRVDRRFIQEDSTNKGIEQENVRLENNLSSLNTFLTNLNMNKKSISNFSQKEKTVTHNLANMLSLKQSEYPQKSIEPEKIIPKESYLPAKHNSEDRFNPESLKSHQTNLLEAEVNNSVDDDLFETENSEKQPDNSILSMTVTSPPDVIPVENNSQPTSQGKISQTYSDSSPLELNEKEQLAYQRIAAESPEFIYPKNPDFMNLYKSGGDVTESLVRSQYFSEQQPFSPPTESGLNTPPMDQEDNYQSMPFSPGSFDMANSPPSGALDGFNVASSSTERPLFGNTNKRDEGNQNSGGFSFSFGGGPKKSSIFSLF